MISERGVLLVAATDLELCGHPGLECGVGPVEAAASTAAYLAREKPRAILHVGVAGGRGITPGSLAIGTEAVYADLIVMGVHGRGALDLLVFGSNTTRVLRAAACPVLIVRG